jgi:hypothetical protein
MNCKDVQELLPLHVGGDLAAKKAQSLTGHLEDCSACAASAAEYRESFQLTKNFEPPVFSSEFYDGIRQSVLSEVARDSVAAKPWFLAGFLPLTFRFRPEWAVAAVLVIAVLAVYFVGIRYKSSLETVKAPTLGHPTDIAPTKPPEVAGPIVTPNPLDKERPQVVNNKNPIRKPRQSKVTRTVKDPTYIPQRIDSPQQSVAASAPATKDSEKPLRVEMQTNDKNIRIIWFTYQNAKHDSPGKGSKGI